MRYLCIVLLVFVTLGCNRHNGGEPESGKLHARLERGEAVPLEVIGFLVTELDTDGDYTVQYDVGDGVIVTSGTRIDTIRKRLEAVTPFGRLDLYEGFTDGIVVARVVQTTWDGSRKYQVLSDWLTLNIRPTDQGEDSWLLGDIGFSAIFGLETVLTETMADAVALEAASSGEWGAADIFQSSMESIRGAESLARALIYTLAGLSTDFGEQNGWRPFFSRIIGVEIVERSILALNDSLSRRFGADPPDPQDYASFYSALGDDFPEFVIDYCFVSSNAATIMLDTVGAIAKQDPGGLFRILRLGGFMMSALELTLSARTLLADAMLGAASYGEAKFFRVYPVIAALTADLELAVREHLRNFRNLYGDFAETETAFVNGIEDANQFADVLVDAYALGLPPAIGLPPSGFELGLEMLDFGETFSVLAETDPPTSNSLLRMYAVTEGGETTIFDGITSESGTVIFPELLLGKFTALFVFHHVGDARGVMIVRP